MIPLSRLTVSPLNVRSRVYVQSRIDSLAATIQNVGLLHNLIAHDMPDGMLGVACGGRRLTALDTLIASRGERCPSPLPQDTAPRLFPVTALRQRERLDKRSAHRIDRQVSHERRQREQKLRSYQQRLRQSAIELQFHTPLTVGSWYARQQEQEQEQEFFESDVFHLVIAWLPKFTSCRYLDPAWYREEPLWRLMLDIQAEVNGATKAALDADRLALPNRLMLKR
jgi:hypothetical protein